jgi:hypothetical protein
MSGQRAIPETAVVRVGHSASAPSSHPEAPWLRQNNPTGKIPLSLSGKSVI